MGPRIMDVSSDAISIAKTNARSFGGVRRFWWVREQADTPLFREHCRRLARTVAPLIEKAVKTAVTDALGNLPGAPKLPL